MKIGGHFRTIWPVLRRIAGTPAAPPSRPWTTPIEDSRLGTLRLTGLISEASGPTVVILVHGLGGSTESTYMKRTARIAVEMGLSCLRFNLRGADRSGEDIYHAGLSEDLEWVLASPQLARFESILLCGFSLGGHLSLRYATQASDPRLRAVAAACSPLDLDRSVRSIDRPICWAYRRYVLAGLCDMYSRVAGRRELPLSMPEARRIRQIREWDRWTVVPRFGFSSPEDYYRRASVGTRLDRLKVPALLVAANDDPMVPRSSIECALEGAGSNLETRWVTRGGHLSFSAGLDLGEDAALGLSGQMLGWLVRCSGQC